MTLSGDAALRLASTGRRLTTSRRAILEAATSFGGPFTIEDLSAALPGVGRATVFRTVKLLQENDLLCRVVMEDGGVRYQVSTGAHHHHLICGVCQGVQEFADPALDVLIQENARRSAFQLDGHSLELYGRCRRCASSSPASR